jgi:hypothetical protein
MRKIIETFISKHAGYIATLLVLIGFLIIVLFLFISPFNDWSFENNATLFSQYGDFIGGFIGPVFSLAAFFLIYKTLITQQVALEQQDSVSRQDRFEITFFNLLKTQRDIANDIKAYFFSYNTASKTKTYTATGRDFFIYSKGELNNLWDSLESKTYLGFYDVDEARSDHNLIDQYYNDPDRNDSQDDDSYKEEEEAKLNNKHNLQRINKAYAIDKAKWEDAKKMKIQEKMSLVYGLYFQNFHYMAGHYFRHLYHILDFADKSLLKQLSFTKDPIIEQEIKENFKKYISFIQAQMSSYELMLLFYNSLSFPKMLKLIKKHNFLENLAVEDLINESHDCIKGINLKSRVDLI